MIFDKETAQKTAEQLLQIKAIKLQPEQPFTWASGLLSPIYCDNRITLSYPIVRTYLREQMAKMIERKYGKPNVIAGVATGAIALGVLVAQEMGLPFVYVRPEPKSHGRMNQIEGIIQSGQSVVVVEDLISTGGSSLKAVAALRETNAHVLGMAALFTYDFPLATHNFKEANCDLYTLSDYHHLLEMVGQNGYIDAPTMETLRKWRENPEAWTPLIK